MNTHIINHNVFESWPLEDNSVQSLITSPPYFFIRKYNIPDVLIGGDKNCEHEFSENITDPEGAKGVDATLGANKYSEQTLRDKPIVNYVCLKCNCFRGQYGHEVVPFGQPYGYIEHTMLWLKEAWRVLKKDGCIFVVVDDKYQMRTGTNPKKKSKLCIPEEIMIGMRNAGWIIRNRINWIRTMPESCKSRFSAQSETIIFATKSPNKYYFNLEAVKERITESTFTRYLRNFNSDRDYKAHGGAINIEASKRIAEKFKAGLAKLPKPYTTKKFKKTDQPISITDGKSGGHYFGDGINAPDSSYKQKFANSDFYNQVMTKNPGDIWLNYYLECTREIVKEKGIDGYIEILKDQILSKSDLFPPLIEGLRDEHYSAFSQKLCERLILVSTKAGDTVLDPFCGSGTTGKVCLALNRNFVGFELGYEDIQQRRLSGTQLGMF